MHKYEPERKELAPRDVVSKCMMQEAKAIGSNDFYLDISYKDPEFVKNRFPMIYKRVLEKGYDMTKEPIPIYPCQHYLMGGIAVNGYGATTIRDCTRQANALIQAFTETIGLPATRCLRLLFSPV